MSHQFKDQVEQLQSYLQAVVRIDSSNPPGNELAVLRFFEDILKERAIPYRVYSVASERASLVAVLEADPESTYQPEDCLVFCGHMDVVPVREEELASWHYPPFAAEFDQGRIYGRGACDMKSGLMAAFYAFLHLDEAIKTEGLKLKAPVYFAATCDEEDTMLGIRSLVHEAALPAKSSVMICEPTDLKMSTASR
ncbi:MAG: M20/M25/M40 family metallo-hydrolase, partial [Eubacteriales bacterium]|nr:M20/M25/M40 family metallo-hydrolase [Eubacteriales bacterium]